MKNIINRHLTNLKKVGKDGVVDTRWNVKQTYEENARQNLGEAQQHESNRENEQDNLLQDIIRKGMGVMKNWYTHVYTISFHHPTI